MANCEEHGSSLDVEKVFLLFDYSLHHFFSFQSNQMIYMTDLLGAMVEEARWRAEIAADPEISALLSEVKSS